MDCDKVIPFTSSMTKYIKKTRFVIKKQILQYSFHRQILVMGNIEIVDQSQRRRSIFHPPSTSPYRRSKSPRLTTQQDNQDTNRYSRQSQFWRKTANETQIQQTSRKSNRAYFRVEQKKETFRSQEQQQQQYAQQIGRMNRVSNFNDFLNEIRRQMTQNSQDHSQSSVPFNQTLRKTELHKLEPEQSSKDLSRELKINLRLQNQRFQLEKYKKIVQRQLSKSHSIEKISLQNKQDNEKMLVIKYGEYGKQENYHVGKSPSNMTFGDCVAKKEWNLPIKQKVARQIQQHSVILQRTKDLMKQMKQRMSNIQSFILSQQKQHEQSQSSSHSKQRIQKINNLLFGLGNLQEQQIQLQNQIKAAINLNDQGQSQISEDTIQITSHRTEKR